MNKKLVKIIPITLCMFLTFTSCSEKANKISSEVSVAIQKESTEATEEKQIDKRENNKKIADIYTKVLDNIDTYSFVEYGEEGSVTYSYDLVNTNSSDIPQLVVAQNTDYGLANIKIFSANNDFTKEITSDETYPIGFASAGGFRADITQSENRDALLYTSISAGTGVATKEKITTSIEDDNLELQSEDIWEGLIDSMAEDNSIKINFTDIADRKKIENLANTIDGEFTNSIGTTNDAKANENNKSEDKSLESKVQAERNAGKMIVSGLVRVFSHKELVEYQNVSSGIFPDYGETYVLLLLEDYEDINMQSGGGPGHFTRKVKTIVLPANLASYDNKHITISFTADDGIWPSDSTLTMDAPIMNSVNVLGEK